MCSVGEGGGSGCDSHYQLQFQNKLGRLNYLDAFTLKFIKWQNYFEPLKTLRRELGVISYNVSWKQETICISGMAELFL